MNHDIFIPHGGDRASTAALLVGVAEDSGISQRSIRSTYNGYYITQELADAMDKSFADDLFADDEPVSENSEPDPEASAKKAATTKKTSGNRAAKTNSKKEE